jgi:hypothetical protein
LILAKVLLLIGSLAGCALIVGTSPRVVGDACVDAGTGTEDCDDACDCHALCDSSSKACTDGWRTPDQ